MLGHLELVDHLADLEPDLVGADEASLLNRRDDGGEGFFGGDQQLAALALAFFGQERIATSDQPFAGVVGMGELGQVALVEEAELEGSVVFDQGGDLGRPQAGQPPEVAHFA